MIAWSSAKKPSSGKPSIRFFLSKIRMTTDSPWMVGTVETRRSNVGPSAVAKEIRPSKGSRFSAMLMLDMILIRLTMLDCRRFGGSRISCKLPSMR